MFNLVIQRSGKTPFKLKTFLSKESDLNTWDIFKSKIYDSEWKKAFSEGFENAAAKLGDKIFIPSKSLEPVPFRKGNNWEFKLCQFGVPLTVLKENLEGYFLETIQLIPRDDHDQSDDLVIDVDKVPTDQIADLEMDLKLLKQKSEIGKECEFETLFVKVPLKSWKYYMLNNFDSSKIFYLKSKNDVVGKRVDIKSEDSVKDSKMVDVDKRELIPCKTYMRFKVTPRASSSSDPVNISTNYPKVRDSLKHDLTLSGTLTLKRMEDIFLSRFHDWIKRKKEYIAPAVSLCQSSGSGKTKISIECIKRNPGFYLVFRHSEHTGYPRSNQLSQELTSIISTYADPATSLMNFHYTKCTVGKILDFFARILTSYINALVAKSRSLIETQGISEEEAIQKAIADFGSMFQENDSLQTKFSVFDSLKMNSIYRHYAGNVEDTNINVNFISEFISKILLSPQNCLVDPENSSSISICQKLFSKIDLFPFLFILDEADLLADMKFKQKDSETIVSGFEVLRRAMGYLEPGAKMLFITLGTKSNIVDLNPLVIDMSSRFLKRDSILEPITFGNTSIFAKEYSIKAIIKKISYELFRNPLMFKFLLTFGHGLWGSFPFSAAVNAANMKLTNGSALTKAYFLPIWMIRTGITANPFHLETKSLIANHMATLSDIQDGVKSMIVSYPSEPILALSARSLIESNTDEALFSVLKQKTEAVAIDIGRFAEVFASMIILRAIDLAPNYALPAGPRFYDNRLKEINEMVPEFKSLWEKKNHLLEIENDDSLGELMDFSDYKVCKVSDFLREFTGTDTDWEKQLPLNILEGIVNAKHMVNLNRDDEGFSLIRGYKYSPRILPSADSRIKDSSRNVIDAILLKNGLLRQCAFLLPANYYGLDIVIPVCLTNGQVTYIGVQVKRADANTSDDIFKMQSRFHYVKCAHCETFTGKVCPNCSTDLEGLKEIYRNSVTLLISLDEEGKYTSFGRKKNQKVRIKSKKNAESLATALEPNFCADKIQITGTSSSFFKPLIQTVEPIRDNVALIKSLWCDKYVKLEPGKEKIDKFIDDKFIHRQFCISTRGWDAFKTLFHNPSKCFEIGINILSREGLFKNCKNRSNPFIIRDVLSHTSPNYMEYADDLWEPRGNYDSYLEKLDAFESGKTALEKSFINPKNEITEQKVPTPPSSPKQKK